MIQVALALLAAAAAPPEKPGDRSATPAETLGAAAAVDPLTEVDQIAAAAAAQPLGTLANPVRVGGPEGARDYVGRLRCANGATPRVGAVRPGGIGAYGSVTQVHPLDCGSAGPGRVELVLDLYHEERPETRPPAGFTLSGR